MPNPPKMEPQRGSRGRGITNLPSGGRKGNPPTWPIPGRMSGDEEQAWRQLWSTPQAAAWDRMGAGTCREVARYCRLLIASESSDATAATHAQTTALADRLGLTPKAMRLLLWQIAPDEVGAKREQAGGASARDRMKVV